MFYEKKKAKQENSELLNLKIRNLKKYISDFRLVYDNHFEHFLSHFI